MREQYTRRFRLKLNQLFWIIIWWTLLGALDALGAYSLSAGWSVRDAGVVRFVLFNTLSAFFSGIISGGFLVFFLRDRFTMKSFGFALLISSFVICFRLLFPSAEYFTCVQNMMGIKTLLNIPHQPDLCFPEYNIHIRFLDQTNAMFTTDGTTQFIHQFK